MAPKVRIEYAGVIARSNQGRDIHADDHDRRLWLETVIINATSKPPHSVLIAKR